MKIINTMAYAAVAAVAAYNVYLAADVQQVNNDLTFDTIELTATGAEIGGEKGGTNSGNTNVCFDDICSPGSPAYMAYYFGITPGSQGGHSFYVGKDPYCVNANYGHDNGNQAYGNNGGNSSQNNGGLKSQPGGNGGTWLKIGSYTYAVNSQGNLNTIYSTIHYICQSSGSSIGECVAGKHKDVTTYTNPYKVVTNYLD